MRIRLLCGEKLWRRWSGLDGLSGEELCRGRYKTVIEGHVNSCSFCLFFLPAGIRDERTARMLIVPMIITIIPEEITNLQNARPIDSCDAVGLLRFANTEFPIKHIAMPSMTKPD